MGIREKNWKGRLWATELPKYQAEQQEMPNQNLAKLHLGPGSVEGGMEEKD